jgi:hypothetical protein
MQTNQARHRGRGWRLQRLTVLHLRFQSSPDADRDWMNFPCGSCGTISLPPRPCVWLLVWIHFPESILVMKIRALCNATITVYTCFPLMFWAVCLALRFLSRLHSHRRFSNMHHFCRASSSWADLRLSSFALRTSAYRLSEFDVRITFSKHSAHRLPTVSLRSEVK